MTQLPIPRHKRAFKIMYDGMIYHQQPAGGINRYFEKLINHLPDDVTPHMTLTRTRPTNFPQHKNLQLHLRQFQLPKPLRGIGRLIQALEFKKINQKQRPDLIHATYYSTLSRCERGGSGPPLIVTVHDMTHEIFPHLLDRSGKYAVMKRRAIAAADAIICVSNRTRDDLLERYPECESRSTVIHHATELGTVKPDQWKPASDRPFFLYVGSRSAYKNFDFLLRAFRNLKQAEPELQLRAVGKAFSSQEQFRIAAHGLKDHVINEGFTSDSRLAQLYRLSTGLVYPSLYEGFGLPLLEAMSCGTPVIAANCSCIPEVVGKAALLFNPSSETELTASLKTVLHNTKMREALIAAGRQRCQEFSWTKAAAQTVTVYESALAASRIKTGFRLSKLPENTFFPNRGPQFALPFLMPTAAFGPAKRAA